MTDEMNIVSLDQIIEQHQNRKVVPLCLTADLALGGGIPFGCTGIVAGEPKLGKTTLSLTYASNAQQLYDSEVYFFNAERRLTNKQLAQVPGLNKEKFFIIQPPYKKNKSGEVVGQEIWSSATWLEYVGEVVSQKRGAFIIVDSLSKLASEKIQSEDLNYQDRASGKKVESAFYAKYGDLVVPNEHILLFIAQSYANVSGYGRSTFIKVGSSIKYQSDLIIVGKKTEKWKEDSQTKRIHGHDMVYQVDESPLSAPHAEMRIPLRYGYGIDIIKDTITHCINWGIIEKAAAWYKIPYVENTDGEPVYCELEDQDEFIKNNKGYKSIKLNGEKAVYDWLNIHPKEYSEVDSKIRSYILT